MKLHGNSLIYGAAVAIFAAQPVWAQSAQVTGVQVKQVGDGINLVLDASSGDRAQVFTTKRGNDLIADLINTQLRLPQGNTFRQENPAPGIASIAINQLDANSVRVIVTGNKGTPGAQPVTRGSSGLTLSFTPGDGTVAAAPPITAPTAPAAPPTGISQRPAPAEGPGQPSNAAPPFLPRAVAPPVGDIAISAIDASPSVLDLGTQERVPRLVLRDAPVREVLSLLARAANMNLAYSSGSADEKGAGATAGAEGPKISLDIQNEPVQDVFNYVLRLSGLEANRSGRTIFVGSKLPNSSRDTVMRNLRLNQVTVGVALNFLVGLGAESAVSRERQVTSVNAVPVGSGVASITQTQTTTESRVENQRIDFQDSKPLLRGLQALGDERTNSLTLIGPPKLVEMAMAQLGQLDIRRRQVSINVKIIDVNLLNTKNINSSFSFGLGNNFFVNDGGAAALNFGGVNPPSAAQTTATGGLTPPIINNVYRTAQPFLYPNNPNQGYIPLDNPLEPGVTSALSTTDQIVPIEIDERTGVPTKYAIRGVTSNSTLSLPSLYQFPKRFLSTLQAQVTSGNAKILTDPTLTVQEGQQALVNLTSEVYAGLKLVQTSTNQSLQAIFTREPIIREAGLTLSVKVDRVDDNGFVSLSVAPTVSAPNGSVATPDGEITLLSKRSLQSGAIRLRDGQTLILSGIIQDSDRTSVSKIPVLGDIPLLGSLFRKTNKSNQRNEVIVLLTPQIMDDSERSSYGYNYNPSPEVRGVLEGGGLKVPRK